MVLRKKIGDRIFYKCGVCGRSFGTYETAEKTTKEMARTAAKKCEELCKTGRIPTEGC